MVIVVVSVAVSPFSHHVMVMPPKRSNIVIITIVIVVIIIIVIIIVIVIVIVVIIIITSPIFTKISICCSYLIIFIGMMSPPFVSIPAITVTIKVVPMDESISSSVDL